MFIAAAAVAAATAAAYDGQQWTDYLIALENCGIGTGNFWFSCASTSGTIYKTNIYERCFRGSNILPPKTVDEVSIGTRGNKNVVNIASIIDL